MLVMDALATNFGVLSFERKMCTCTWSCVHVCVHVCAECIMIISITYSMEIFRGPYFCVVCNAHDDVMWHNY